MGTIGLLIVAAGAWLAAAALRSGQSLSVDEPFMANVVQGAWRDVTSAFPGDNLPFGYALLWVWARIFGESEFALRSLSMTAYAGTVFLTGLAARRLGGPRAGLVGAILVAASVTIGLSHAATARPYALLSCLAAAATYLSVAIIQRPPDGTRAGLFLPAALLVVQLLGLFTHPTFALFAAALVVASIGVPRETRLRLAGAGMAAVLIYLALWWPVLRATFAMDATSWMAFASWKDVHYASLIMWGTGRGALLLGALIVLVLASPAAAGRLLRAPASRWICAAAALAWLLPVTISMGLPVFFPSRTPMLLMPATMAALAMVIGRLANGVTVAALCVIMGSGAVVTAIAALGKPDPAPTRASVAAVVARASCGDTLMASGLSGEAVSFYLRQLDSRRCLLYQPFPGIRITGQPGDTGETGRLLERAREVSADLIARRSPVWMFLTTRGIGKESSAILEEELRRSMACGEPTPLLGASFDRVVSCQPRSER